MGSSRSTVLGGRRSVPGSACAGKHVARPGLEAEVDDADLSFGRVADAGGRERTVRELAVVRVAQGVGRLVEDGAGEIDGERAVRADPIPQILAWHERGDEI